MAIDATIKVCIHQGKLVKYLSEHRREVEEFMLALMTSEEAYESYGDYREEIGQQKGEKIGIKKGIEKGIEKGREEGTTEDIRNLMKNLKLTAEQAMEALGIPKGEFNKYMSML